MDNKMGGSSRPPEDQSGGDWNELVASASKHVLERQAAQRDAKAPIKKSGKTPLLVALLVILAVVGGWNLYFFSNLQTLSPEMEEGYLRTSIYLTALVLDSEFTETGAYPRNLVEVGMDEDGLTYSVQDGGYVLRIQGQYVSFEYRSGQSLDVFRESFEAVSSGEIGR